MSRSLPSSGALRPRLGARAPRLLSPPLRSSARRVVGRAPPWWIGAAIGLGLGVRLSWAPLFVPLFALAPPGTRVRTLLVAIGATLSWCIPFIAIVGPSHLLALMRTHATGHFMVWGGSAIREPGATLRAAWLARDLFVDGLGVDADILGLGIAALGTGLGWLGFSAWRANGYPHARWLAFVPYAAWIGLGQNPPSAAPPRTPTCRSPRRSP